jgi:myo-inositol-1(or 4)-monophosphatase
VSETDLSMSDDYLKAAVEVAREAGAILREEFDRPLQISYKGDVDLVTQADKRSEAAIVMRLTEYFPEHAIAAEEGTGHESASDSEYRWHVDPLEAPRTLRMAIPVFASP